MFPMINNISRQVADKGQDFLITQNEDNTYDYSHDSNLCITTHCSFLPFPHRGHSMFFSMIIELLGA